ncbi:RNA polymerase sigma factor [Gimesia maris]|nr:RNA polymerase sigma factor [Gimesia maris]
MKQIFTHFSAPGNRLEDTPEQRSERELNYEFIKYLTRDYQRLFSYIVTFSPNRQDAEDLMQETVIQMWGKFSTFDQDQEFCRWGIGFARNVVRQYHRNRKPTHLAMDDELLSKLSFERLAAEDLLELRREAMQECIAGLPQSQKHLLNSCYVEHSSVSGAAKSLGRTVTALYKALHRIRAKLINCIDMRLKRRTQDGGC